MSQQNLVTKKNQTDHLLSFTKLVKNIMPNIPNSLHKPKRGRNTLKLMYKITLPQHQNQTRTYTHKIQLLTTISNKHNPQTVVVLATNPQHIRMVINHDQNPASRYRWLKLYKSDRECVHHTSTKMASRQGKDS